MYLNGSEYLRNLPWRFANVFALTPSATYELRVDARDSFGNVSQSDVLSLTTPAPTNSVAPTAPTNVQLGFQSGNGEAWLSWARSTDDADPQHLIVYEIYFNGLPNNLESIIGGNSTIAYCTVQGIGMTEVVLRAVDTSGNRSAPSMSSRGCSAPSARRVDCGRAHHFGSERLPPVATGWRPAWLSDLVGELHRRARLEVRGGAEPPRQLDGGA